MATLSGHKGPVFSVAYSRDGTKLLSGSFDNSVKYWDAASGRQISSWEVHTDNVRAVALSPDGGRAISGGSDRKVIYWNTESGTEVAILSGHQGIIRCVAFAPDGKSFVSGGDDKTVRLWEVGAEGEPKAKATWNGHEDGVNDCSFSPDGKSVISASQDKTVIIWDAESGKPVDTLKGHTAPVLAAVFSPDGTLAFTASADKDVRVWDVANGKDLSRWPGHADEINAIAVSPDGSVAITAGRDMQIKIWDVASRQLRSTVSGNDEFIYSAAVSPDSRRAVFGLGDSLKLLDLSSYLRQNAPSAKAPQKLSSDISLTLPPNGVLDAEVKGTVRVTITNTGGLPADCQPSFKFPATPGFSGLKAPIKPFKLFPGKTETFEFPVEASKSIATGSIPIKLEVKEANGFDAPVTLYELQTRSFEAPKLSIENIKVGGSGQIKPGQPAVVVMTVKNAGGIAWEVAAKFNGTSGASFGSLLRGGGDTGVKALSDISVKIGAIEPGETKRLELKFEVAPAFKGTKLPLSVSLSEKRPRYNMSTKPLGLEVSP